MKDLKIIKYIIIAAGAIVSAAFYVTGGIGPGSFGYEMVAEEEPPESGKNDRLSETEGGRAVSEKKEGNPAAATGLSSDLHLSSPDPGEIVVRLSDDQLERIELLIRTAVREEVTAMADEGYLEAALQEAADSAESRVKAREGMVDLNRAGKEELMTLPGIGEKKAEDILAYREANGAFHSIEEITRISGIKEAAFQKIRDKIYVSVQHPWNPGSFR